MATASHKHSGGSIVQGGGADRPPQGTFSSQNPAPEQQQQQLGEAVAAAAAAWRSRSFSTQGKESKKLPKPDNDEVTAPPHFENVLITKSSSSR